MNKKKQKNAPLHPMIWVSTSELSSPVRGNMPGERIKTMISNCITGNLAGGNYTRWLFFSTVQIDLEFGLLVYVKEGEP